MLHELRGSPHVRFLKPYVLGTGKKLLRWQICRRSRKEAKILIEQGIAELYTGPFPPKKKKMNLKDLTL